MIKVSGRTRRDFIFPTDVKNALAFYSDLNRVVSCLSHISMVERFADNEVRVLYNTRELGTYEIYIYSDLQTAVDTKENILYVNDAHTHPPVTPSKSLNSCSNHGLFRSTSRFMPFGGHTRVLYEVELQADLPTPSGLRFVPNRILDKIAGNIVNGRIDEIISGFITQSIATLPIFLAEQALQTNNLGK